jgi:hypothetical protein
MKRSITLLALLISIIPYSFSQQQEPTCKVLLAQISGTYKGGCKDGLADGKGTAIGEDKYVGKFMNGLPEGKGVYTFKNGNEYDGYWKNGRKDGQGKFTYSVNGVQTILKGYWVDDEYKGTSDPKELYRITAASGIETYYIKKLEGDLERTEISFEQVMQKYIPKDLNISVSSGQMKQLNKKIVITDYSYPMNCTLSFTIKIAEIIKQCKMTFEIIKPGYYEVFISNN